ncbi:hypothetical protein [uncultured Tateyamaria sp.]|uniref:hypothetical protein n=1 Tax=uncultured Tateyamaria sp. TaxID=455651 RepID=UPI0026068680|nr:hypothetical protein [uncultured Tateyamaria sp.]
MLAGCSFNDVGLVQVTYQETEAARIRHTVALGFHVETHGPLAGVSLGRFEAVNVHITLCDRLEPRLHYRVVSGLSVTASDHEVGLTLGWRETVLNASSDITPASTVQFDPSNPQDTAVFLGPHDFTSCQEHDSKDADK